jgi:hypothetical protein
VVMPARNDQAASTKTPTISPNQNRSRVRASRRTFLMADGPQEETSRPVFVTVTRLREENAADSRQFDPAVERAVPTPDLITDEADRLGSIAWSLADGCSSPGSLGRFAHVTVLCAWQASSSSLGRAVARQGEAPKLVRPHHSLDATPTDRQPMPT